MYCQRSMGDNFLDINESRNQKRILKLSPLFELFRINMKTMGSDPL